MFVKPDYRHENAAKSDLPFCLRMMIASIYTQRPPRYRAPLPAVADGSLDLPLWRLCTSFWILSVGDRDALMERSWFKELMIAAVYLLISASRYHFAVEKLFLDDKFKVSSDHIVRYPFS